MKRSISLAAVATAAATSAALWLAVPAGAAARPAAFGLAPAEPGPLAEPGTISSASTIPSAGTELVLASPASRLDSRASKVCWDAGASTGTETGSRASQRSESTCTPFSRPALSASASSRARSVHRHYRCRCHLRHGRQGA